MLLTKNDSNVKTASTVAEKIRKINTSMYNSLKSNHDLSYCMVWSNPDFTPEQIIAEFGTDAKALFEASSMVQAVLKKSNPDYVPLVLHKAYNITLNEDGTASVEKIVEPEPDIEPRGLGEGESL